MKKLLAISLLTALSANQTLAFEIGFKELMNEERQQKRAHETIQAGVADYRISAINFEWWENFDDPYLKEYICRAIKNNRDLKLASLRSEEYRQTVKSVFAGQLPTLSFLPTFARVKNPQNQIGDFRIDQSRTNIYAVPLIAKYEADIFLKNRDKTKSAKKDLEAMEYEEKAVYIAVASDISSLYINLLKTDKLIETQEEITKIRLKIFELTRERNKAGLASVYDVTNTDKMHTIAQIELKDLKKQQQILLHQLFVYIGCPPELCCDLPRGKFDKLEFKGKIPEFISSETALQRPDLMKAEAMLKKAKIDVTIARKDFLPRIPIFGVFGWNSLLLDTLFDRRNIVALVAAIVTQKLFTGGKLMADLRIKKIQFEELFEQYKQADLIALQEINDALVMIKYDTEKDNDNLRKFNLEKSNYKLINARYQEGITSYLEMIQYKENLLSLQREKDISKAQRLVDCITLYKATGTAL